MDSGATHPPHPCPPPGKRGRGYPVLFVYLFGKRQQRLLLGGKPGDPSCCPGRHGGEGQACCLPNQSLETLTQP